MPSADEVRTLLGQVTTIDDHAAVLEEAVEALDDLRDIALVEDVLRVFERCVGQDDYGMFSSLGSWIGKHPRSPELDALVQASLLRRPTWKVIEMIGGYTESAAGAADLLERVLKEGTFHDQRYDEGWVRKRIDELRASA